MSFPLEGELTGKSVSCFSLELLFASIRVIRGPRLPEAIELRECADQKAVARDRGCGHAHFFQRILVQQLVFRASLENERVAVLAQSENLSIGRPGRGGERSLPVWPDALLLVNLLACAGVVAAQEAEVEQDIQIIPIKQRR